MAHCPETRTAESLRKHLGSCNVCSSSFAVSEIGGFAKETSWRGSPRGERAATVAQLTTPVQSDAPSLDALVCRGCDQPFDTSDRRRKFCSDLCKRAAFAASLCRRQAAHRARFPERERARQTLNNAINRGKIRRPRRCEDCGAVRMTNGHHSDYSRPLFVTWLCRSCHAALDGGKHFGCGQPKNQFQASPAHPEQPQGHGDIPHLSFHAAHSTALLSGSHR